MKNLALAAGLLFSVNLYASQSIKPFETDYCTMFMEGTWGHCCLEHDLRYWIGGTKKEQLQSDIQLRSCVAESGGDFMANAIYYAVRAGHYSPVKHKYKWSWGWGPKEDFGKLSSEQKRLATEEIRRSSLDDEVIETFVREQLED